MPRTPFKKLLGEQIFFGIPVGFKENEPKLKQYCT